VKQGFTLRLAGEEGKLSRSEFLYQALSRDIVDGVIAPGDHLDEVSIAKRFDVSRTPVREALQALVSSGLAFRQLHRGVIVESLGRSRLNDMFEVMADVEALCAGYAAERMTAKERYALEAMHRDSAALVRDADPQTYGWFNRDFHNAIYDGAHNEFLAESARAVRLRLSPFRGAQFRVDRRMTKSFEEHGQVVDAILRGDAAGARAAMIDHMSVVGEASERFAVDESTGVVPIPDSPLVRDQDTSPDACLDEIPDTSSEADT